MRKLQQLQGVAGVAVLCAGVYLTLGLGCALILLGAFILLGALTGGDR